MGSRTLNNVVNDQTVAFNAMIYGYAGHSLVTPHAAIQQIWWTEEKINETVTRDFVISRIRPSVREFLDRPLGFGDGLTDDTYMEWILEKAKRLFLILVEVGEPDQIFGVVDSSWDDDDLPLQLEDIERLQLSCQRNDMWNRKFYSMQFTFLLRELYQGAHIDYAPNEVLPMEYVHGFPPAVSLQHWSRVHLPQKPNEVLVRRKFSFGSEDSEALEAEFLMDVENSKIVEHDHIAPTWASYTSKGSGYTLTNFVSQHTLKSFIDHRKPPQYQRLAKPDRYYLLLGWLHCLADAVAALHHNGLFHSSIRPSNILIDESNNIAFSDIGSLKSLQRDKKPDPTEIYNYGAPEAHRSSLSLSPDPTVKTSDNRARKTSISSKGSSERSVSKPPPILPATEKSDVFSLGCVYLDILTFMIKKKANDFTKHRSSKQKAESGRGMNTSRTDSSFHGNINKVHSWMKILDDAAFDMDDNAFRAIPHIMSLIRAMISQNPDLRPAAQEVRNRLFEILTNYTDLWDPHCGARDSDSKSKSSGSTYTMQSIRIGVAPSGTFESDMESSLASISLGASPSLPYWPDISSSTDSVRSSTVSGSQESRMASHRVSQATASNFDEPSPISYRNSQATTSSFGGTSYMPTYRASQATTFSQATTLRQSSSMSPAVRDSTSSEATLFDGNASMRTIGPYTYKQGISPPKMAPLPLPPKSSQSQKKLWSRPLARIS
ncbi:kinase-like protein [Glonium stellatum]|uniref:Kinase-like protein n=1 Tax=Glonium stellatum TaxID=574774 RepID=A0A8E2ETN2_9PEZI|nr:kinase-like protein [Glonium stellatum]